MGWSPAGRWTGTSVAGSLAGDSLLRAAVFATIPLAAVFGGLTAVQLYLVAAVYGLLKMTSLAGFPALIPNSWRPVS